MLSSIFNTYPVHLIESVEELKTVVKGFSPKVMVGLDTETKGLEFKPDQVVGICISGGLDYTSNGYSGYYIPIRHAGYHNNLPIDQVMQVVQYIIDHFQTVFHNRNFDLSMLEYDGLVVPFIGGMHDSQIMAYLVLNEPYPALKDYCTRFLKWNMIEFSANGAKDGNFGLTDPTKTFIYGAGDPISTVMLARKLWNDYPYIRRIYKLDNYTLEAVRRMTQTELDLDYEYLEDECKRTEAKLNSLTNQIYTLSGVQGFKIGSARDKVDVLSRFVTLTEKTKKGSYKVDEDALMRLHHPLATLMVEWNSTRTYYNSFVKKLRSFEGTKVRFNYNTVNVPSGRLSSGASSGNPYFSPYNGQNTPKTEVKMYLTRDEKLGFKLLHEQTEDAILDVNGEPIKCKTKSDLRQAFVTPGPDWVWITADYAGQEIALASNFSKEPNFLNPLLEGKDLHMHVAKSMFGFEDPNHRTKVKTLNFACVSDNSMIATDRGYRRPADLMIWPFRLFNLLDRKGKPQTYSAVKFEAETVTIDYSNGIQETYKHDHKVLVSKGSGLEWKEVSSLKTADKVVISTHVVCSLGIPWFVKETDYSVRSIKTPRVWNFSDEDVAWLIGLYLGAGQILSHERYLAVFLNCPKECYEKLKQVAKELGVKIRLNAIGRGWLKVEVGGTAFARAMMNFWGAPGKKHIPDDAFYYCSWRAFRKLLAGVIDSRGNIFSKKSKALLPGISLVASALGIKTDLVRVGKGSKLRFITPPDLIPISRPNSSIVYDKGGEDLYCVHPVRISESGVQTCYAIQCDSHEYISSGIVSHNCLYGAEAPTIAERLQIPREEAKVLMDNYKRTMRRLYAWKAEIVKAAKRRGYSLTFFGRPVYLLKFFNHSDPGMRAYAERLAVNSTIQGCLTKSQYIYNPDKEAELIPVEQGIGNRVVYRTTDGFRVGVPTFRGVDNVFFCLTNSGDFCLVSSAHKFLMPDKMHLVSAFSCKARIQLSKLPKKRQFLSLFSSALSWDELVARIIRGQAINLRDSGIAKRLFLESLKFKEYNMEVHQAMLVRSVVNEFGYNFICTSIDLTDSKVQRGSFTLSRRRPNTTYIKSCFRVGKENVISPSMISGSQCYDAVGMCHKNTGADLARLSMVRMQMYDCKLPEWHEKVRFRSQVHDEINNAVKGDYLHTAFLLTKKAMDFYNPAFEVPVVVDVGVGTNWGNCLDVVAITLTNKLIPKGVDPESLRDCDREYLVQLINECKFEELPKNLKTYHKDFNI